MPHLWWDVPAEVIQRIWVEISALSNLSFRARDELLSSKYFHDSKRIERDIEGTSKRRIWILNARQMKCLALFPSRWNLLENLYTKFPRIRYPTSAGEALLKLGIMRSTCEYFISRISEVETSDSSRISTCSKGHGEIFQVWLFVKFTHSNSRKSEFLQMF